MSRRDDGLGAYRRKRDASRTPEPVPGEGPLPHGADDTFVVQEHHARRLHWDFRLERGGVLVSWAIPKGMPQDRETNHLAVHTEDHPLEYASFEGEIPRGEYGAGRVIIWDRGSYETEKWSDREVKVVLNGSRVAGRYVLFQTRGENWMIHRMDPPQDPGWRPLPQRVAPMRAVTRRRLPADPERYGFEFGWAGRRVICYAEGGRLRLLDEDVEQPGHERSGTGRGAGRGAMGATGRGTGGGAGRSAGGGAGGGTGRIGVGDRDGAGLDVTDRYPELRRLGAELGARQVVLDGELVALDRDGRPDPALLVRRAGATTPNEIRKASRDIPVTYVVYDLLHLDGRPLLEKPYTERRAALAALDLGDRHWQTSPWFPGEGEAVAKAARAQGLPVLFAKRLDAPYRPGRNTTLWLRIPVSG